MTPEELAAFAEGTRHEIKSLKHRVDEQDAASKDIKDLILTVNELAINMRYMIEEQKCQGTRLNTLEKAPAKKWNQLTAALISGIIGIVLGMLANGMFPKP